MTSDWREIVAAIVRPALGGITGSFLPQMTSVGARIEAASLRRSCSGELKLRHSPLTAARPGSWRVVAMPTSRTCRSASLCGRM